MLPFPSPLLLGQGVGGAPAAPYGSHLYWRLWIDTNNGSGSLTALGELEMRTTSGGSNVCTGGTPFDGGAGTSGGAASLAFDGSVTNAWYRNATGAVYLGYQFASAVGIAEIVMKGESGATNVNQFPRSGKLQHSDDGSTYTDAFSFYERSWSATGDTRTWPQDTTGGKYKMFRLLISANNVNRFTLIEEIEMHGTVGGSDQCNGGAAFGSQSNTNGEPALAFDNTDANPFQLDNNVAALPGYVGYAFPSPVSVAEYTVRCTANAGGSNARTPNAWKLQGSNDNVTWTDLNSQTGITWAIPQTKTFVV